MAVNQSHTENRRGVVIPYGESVLKQCQNVDLSFLQQPEGSNLFGGTKKGMLFLTSFRVIFVTSHSVNDPMFSFMMPFDLMSNCTIEQPVFASNYIKGTIRAAPDGGWEGQATFKLTFRKGGAITFAQLMMKAASAAAQGVPLGSVNYWFGAPGLCFITGQGGMICNQGMPCPAYPVMMYGSQQVRYGTLPGGYGAPPAGYGALPVGYRAQFVGCGALPAGYGAPPGGSGAPPGGSGAPPGGSGAPSGRSEALPAGYGAPPAGHESSLVGYGAPPAGNETLPAENEAPPLGYEAPPARNRPGSHKSVAAQPAGYETSLSSASSSQAYSPPSEK